MPKLKKVIVFDGITQVYPCDDAETIWHVWREDGPVAEIQFHDGPVDVDAGSEAVIQDCPDYIGTAIPEGHEQVFEDRRTSWDVAEVHNTPRQPGVHATYRAVCSACGAEAVVPRHEVILSDHVHPPRMWLPDGWTWLGYLPLCPKHKVIVQDLE